MYVITHPKHGETTVYTELALSRHEAAGWKLKEPQEKAEQPKAEDTKRTRKAKQ